MDLHGALKLDKSLALKRFDDQIASRLQATGPRIRAPARPDARFAPDRPIRHRLDWGPGPTPQGRLSGLRDWRRARPAPQARENQPARSARRRPDPSPPDRARRCAPSAPVVRAAIETSFRAPSPDPRPPCRVGTACPFGQLGKLECGTRAVAEPLRLLHPMIVDVLLHPRFAEAVLLAGRTEGFFGSAMMSCNIPCVSAVEQAKTPEMLRVQHDLSIDAPRRGA